MVFAILLLPGCDSGESAAAAAARDFLDAHYVRIDLAAAKGLSTGLATEKVGEEIRLVGGVVPDSEAMKPRIHYRREKVWKEAENDATYAYVLTVTPPGSAAFHKRVLVTVRRVEEGWKVSNYRESDVSAP